MAIDSAEARLEVATKDGRSALGPVPVSELEPVAERDGVWLQDRESNLMVINSVLTTDQMTIEDLRHVFLERVVQFDSGVPYGRFRRMIVRSGDRFFWREDEAFDIRRHIVTVEGDGLHTRDGLQEFIGRQASRPLPDDRPLWQFLFVPDFGDGGTAIVVRIHHVMGDGVSMVPILFSLMDVDQNDPPDPDARQVKTRGTAGKLWQIFTKAALTGPFLLGARAVTPADRSVLHGPELAGHKRVAWTRPLALDRIKAIKNRLGATVNDVLLAAVSGAFRRYAESHPEESELGRVRVSMPVNVRPPSEKPKLENKFAAVMLDLPVDVSDLRARLDETKRRMDALKRSVEPMIYYGAVNVLLKTLPRSWSHWLVDFYARKCTAVLSNVPGPQDVLYVAGRRVRAMLFWVPQRANIGLGISILSFSGDVRIGVFSDVQVMSEPMAFVDAVEAELDLLDELA
ncbi:MAG: WS/DGAT domain-containing protein [Thermoanaerobaculia bacterium]|nr:WS/DGAT domain-containing protein [Thermoanaerobaculia bacterium]